MVRAARRTATAASEALRGGRLDEVADLADGDGEGGDVVDGAEADVRDRRQAALGARVGGHVPADPLPHGAVVGLGAQDLAGQGAVDVVKVLPQRRAGEDLPAIV